MSVSTTQKIENIISELDSEAVFISADFLEIGDYEAVRKALNRLAGKGVITKIMRGVYYQPRFSEFLGEHEAPPPHQVALAIARKLNWNIAPSGVTALSLLGLSTQVSAKWSYISDGANNRYEFGNTVLEFKHRSNREITGMSPATALIIQGIKALGKNNIDSAAIVQMRLSLTEAERGVLVKEAKSTAVWVYNVIKQIDWGG